jgi:hypothetical protein
MYQETYTNQVTLVESPQYSEAVDSNTIVLALLAGVAGLVASLAIVFAFEYFGGVLKKPEEAASRTPRRHAGGIDEPGSENIAAYRQNMPAKDNNLDVVDKSRSKPSTAASTNR